MEKNNNELIELTEDQLEDAVGGINMTVFGSGAKLFTCEKCSKFYVANGEAKTAYVEYTCPTCSTALLGVDKASGTTGFIML